MPPNTSAGNKIMRNENKATIQVPQRIVSALTDTTTNELDTKVSNERSGRKTRPTKIVKKTEMTGWFTINSLICLSMRTARYFLKVFTRCAIKCRLFINSGDM